MEGLFFWGIKNLLFRTYNFIYKVESFSKSLQRKEINIFFRLVCLGGKFRLRAQGTKRGGKTIFVQPGKRRMGF